MEYAEAAVIMELSWVAREMTGKDVLRGGHAGRLGLGLSSEAKPQGESEDRRAGGDSCVTRYRG